MADEEKQEQFPWEKDPSELTYDWGNMAFIHIDSPHVSGLQGAFVFDATPEGVAFWWENRHNDTGHLRWRKMSELYAAHLEQTSGTAEAEDPAAISEAEVVDEPSGD